MKLLLIGQSVEDHIYYKNDHIVKPGGIYYSVSALQNYKEDEDEIYLCTSFEKNNGLFKGLYSKVKPDYLNYTDVIPKVRLNVFDDKEREEIYENITGGLAIETSDLNELDGILVNMVTGFDLSLAKMKEIRKSYKGIIYFDVHTFSRGLNKDMKREFRIIPEFEKWIDYIDILQVNSRELFTLVDSENKTEIIKFVLNRGVKLLLETKGINGAAVYYKENSKIKFEVLPSISLDVKNQVGLGDVFGAIFFYSYIKNGAHDQALKEAITAGGCAAGYKNFEDFKNLKKDVLTRYN